MLEACLGLETVSCASQFGEWFKPDQVTAPRAVRWVPSRWEVTWSYWDRG